MPEWGERPMVARPAWADDPAMRPPSSHAIADEALREVPLLDVSETVSSALVTLLDSGVPALPVVDVNGRWMGVFGEREFLAAVYPGYFGQLRNADFVPRSIDERLQLRVEGAGEPVGRHMTTEHVDVRSDYSDAQLAEIFLHHRVLIVPVLDSGTVRGVILRSDFFRRVAARLRQSTE